MVEAPGYSETKNNNIAVTVSASSNRKTAFYRFVLDESNAIICFGLRLILANIQGVFEVEAFLVI
jgi:hypothetical protein